MVVNSSLQFLLSDGESLASYSEGNSVTFKDIERRLFLKLREQNRSIPDHYYRLNNQISLQQSGQIWEVFIKNLPEFVANYLHFQGNRVHVQADRQNEWQELITYLPPLLLQSIHIFANKALDEAKLVSSFNQLILPNALYTALPQPYIPQLNYLLEQQEGFHDLHMHLNGAIETDWVWQDYLRDPNVAYLELVKAYKSQKVREQLEQESHLFNPIRFVTLLKAGQKMRYFFWDYLYPSKQNAIKYITRSNLVATFLNNYSTYPASYKHPFLQLLDQDGTYKHLLAVESLMYILVLRRLERDKSELLAGVFHFYLLILGLTNRLLVQQTHQKGFEQFQKHTLNGLREKSEKVYLRRYYQMHGNELRNIRFLEGRFSPKKTQAEMISFVDGIWEGWSTMKKQIKDNEEKERRIFKEPELLLIAHFIKQPDEKKDIFIRHKKLRYETWQKARVLALLIKKYPTYRKRIVAVDAAASEFDAPPEVFAPGFRLMRRAGIKHFTFHAGEDFYHIISGLRAVYEAITFCDLQQSDRIGHATATGICPQLWLNEVGNKILISRGEWLDNLIFAYHLILNAENGTLKKLVPIIINAAQNFGHEIYGEYYPIAVLEKAWQMRQCCPVHALGERKGDIQYLSVFNNDEWIFPVDRKFIEDRRKITSEKVWTIFSKYHDRVRRNLYEEIIQLDPVEIFGIEEIKMLQLEILRFMSKKEIVIETLPTSNIRIGIHRNYSTYHLWNWLKWKKEGQQIPPIVVGSDDTGIFATNIYNEYANIYCFLLNDCKLGHSEVMDIIKKLDEDSRIYRFQ